MQMPPQLVQRPVQTLAITPELIQSLKLLQYSQAELNDFLQSELEKNPLIDLAAGPGKMGVSDAAGSDDTPDRETTAAGGAPGPAGSGDAKETGSAERASGMSLSGSRTKRTAPGEAAVNLEEIHASKECLRDHLRRQLPLSMRELDLIIAHQLIDSLDSDGYFRHDIEDIAERLGIEGVRIEKVLRSIQLMDPTGVGARNLAECLRSQLAEKDRLDPAMQCMLDNIDLVANFDIAQLSRLCGVDQEDIVDMVQEIRALDPRPGRHFEAEPIQLAMPDVIVRTRRDGTHVVELNSELLPRVLVDRQYYAEVSGSCRETREKKFLSDCLASANWLAKNLDQRARTILKVATEIVAQQEMFLRHGVRCLKPLGLKDVAEAVGLHESTVSRATSNKYIMTNRGLFELKYFFTNPIAASAGTEEVSAETVRHMIRTMIDAETAKTVLSDDAIVKSLQTSGIAIARRTVAKYRDAMNIPSSVRRRRIKTALCTT